MLLPPLLPMLLSIVRLGPIQYPEQYIWTNIQEGNVNLKLLFLLLQNDSNENEISEENLLQNDSNGNEISEENLLQNDSNGNEISEENLLQGNVPKKVINGNEISEENLLQGNVPKKVINGKEIWGNKKIVVPEPYRLSSIPDDQFLMYKIISISLKFQNRAQEWIDGNLYDGSTQRGKILGDEKNISSSLNLEDILLEDILLPKRRREFRILNRFDPENENVGFSNGKDIKNDEELMGRDQHLSVDTTQIIKRFLWPSYRLEDLICMNRYWFNTNDGSRSAMLRIRMYPQTFN